MPAQDPDQNFIVAEDDGLVKLDNSQASQGSVVDGVGVGQDLNTHSPSEPEDKTIELKKNDAIDLSLSENEVNPESVNGSPLDRKTTDQPLKNNTFVTDVTEPLPSKELSDNKQDAISQIGKNKLNSSSSVTSSSVTTSPVTTSPVTTSPTQTNHFNGASNGNFNNGYFNNGYFNNGQAKVATHFTELLGVLVQNQVLTEEQAQEINSVQLATNKDLEDILKESELVSELNLVKAKAELNQVPFVAINETGVAPEALSQVDESVARRYTALPFALDQEEKKIRVAMADPLNISAISFIEQKTGLKVEACYATPSELKRLISERYAQDLSSDVSAALEETQTIKTGDLDIIQGQEGGFVKAAPINKIVSTILDYAMQSRASDVHIEPMVSKTRVRYRIDGILQEKLILPKTVHEAVVSRIKILSDLKIDEKRVPQDGRFDHSVAGQDVDLRVSTMPSVHGEKVVMRLLMKNQSVPGLEELGMKGLALQLVNQMIRIPYGIFLVTGPTGSGKTTSLYSILNNINTPKVNIMTLEDPVEYQMPGITQVQVRPQAGLTFANGLRSFLRQDPDIIMVGEIRDTETAELAVQASLTGHLVFATLHTNSASGALSRLVDMKVEPFLLSSSMILVMGQRVVRKINAEYKEEYQPDAEVVADIKRVLGNHFNTWCVENNKDPENIILYRPKKDRPQTEPEYKGRTGIFEVLNITDEVKSLINKQATTEEINEVAMKNGMMLMKQDGYIKALEGITTIEEVLRVAEVK